MTGIIIQARTGSTRLPGKVAKKILGKSILEHVIDRAKQVKNSEKVILATTDKSQDDILEKIGKDCLIPVFRGADEDVLDRIYQAAKAFNVDPIVRITSDCPLFDIKIAEKVIDLYFSGAYDYVSNSHPPTFPDGLDVEVFRSLALEKNWKEAKTLEEREHVYPYMFREGKFRTANLTNDNDLSDMRLTLDEDADFVLIEKIYKLLYSKNRFFGLKEILELFNEKPEMLSINRHIVAQAVSRWKKDQTKI